MKKLDLDGKIFDSPQASNIKKNFNKFLKYQEIGYLKDISDLHLREKDIGFINSLELQLDDYLDLYCDPDSYEFDQERYDNNVEDDIPGLKDFCKCFNRFQDKLNVDYLNEEYYYDTDDGFDIYKNLETESESDSD